MKIIKPMLAYSVGKEALAECAFEKYENKYDTDNIYKLAIIEYKIVKKQVENGFLKKILTQYYIVNYITIN